MLDCLRAAPQLAFTDLDRALRFWTTDLFFEVTFVNASPLCFAILTNGEAVIHLKVDPERAGQGHCHLLAEDLEQFADQFGGPVLQPLTEQSWGLRDLLVADPDGNTIELAERC